MRTWGVLGLALLLSSCGDSNSDAAPRNAAEACDAICGWPDECFTELGVPVQDADCVQSCQAQVELVGVDCIVALARTVDCLGTCDLESLSEEQILDCRDEAEAISQGCD
ncbi:MAG: hypothetical protein WCE62_20480 [Polyangiales bacterium]